MKRIQKWLLKLSLTAGMVLMLSMAAFAAEAPSAELRGAADALDLSSDPSAHTSEMASLHASGVQLFDTAGLLSAEDKDKVELVLSEVRNRTNLDTVVVTSGGLGSCSDVEDYADLLYYEGQLGNGSDKDGSLLVVDLVDRDVYIYTHGLAIRYLTDRGLDYIYDEFNGGLINKLSSGDYAGAFAVYAGGILQLYNEGIQQDQNNVNTDTGEVDYYYPQEPEKKRLSPIQAIIAAVVSAVSGILPVNNVKRKYAMETEKHLAQGFNQAYKATAVYNILKGQDAQLIDRKTRVIPIPKPTTTSSGRSGGVGGHGGGTSHVSSGRGGSVHGGGGRKF